MRHISSAQNHMWLVATVPDNIGLEAGFWNPQAFGTLLDPKSVWILKVSNAFLIASLFEHPEAKERGVS